MLSYSEMFIKEAPQQKKQKHPGPNVSRLYFLVGVLRLQILQRRNAEREVDAEGAEEENKDQVGQRGD